MKAEKAREITNNTKLDRDASLKRFSEAIEAMAEAGNDYASIDPKRFKDPEQLKSDLEALGYKVTLSDISICANW